MKSRHLPLFDVCQLELSIRRKSGCGVDQTEIGVCVYQLSNALTGPVARWAWRSAVKRAIAGSSPSMYSFYHTLLLVTWLSAGRPLHPFYLLMTKRKGRPRHGGRPGVRWTARQTAERTRGTAEGTADGTARGAARRTARRTAGAPALTRIDSDDLPGGPGHGGRHGGRHGGPMSQTRANFHIGLPLI